MKMLLALMPPASIAILGAFLMSLTWFGALIVIFGALDTHGRWRDYRYLSRFNYMTPRLAAFYGRSFCGRWLVCVLAPDWREGYKREGYKWWHFLPDDFPHFFVNPRFWRAMFLGHTHDAYR